MRKWKVVKSDHGLGWWATGPATLPGVFSTWQAAFAYAFKEATVELSDR